MTDKDIHDSAKSEIQSDDPIIQKCLDIIRNPKAWVSDLVDAGYYSVHIGNKEYFTFNKSCLLWLGTKYKLTVGLQDYHFGGERPDLEDLHRLCVAKYKEQSQEREKKALDFLNDVGNKRSITPFLFMFAGLIFAAAGVISYKGSEKRERVKKQVEAYEKTLPADYMEYKQAVEHYRDSLMHVKGR